MGSFPGRRLRLVAILAFGVPFAVALGWCVLLRPEVGSVIAPVFGPWAGHVYGHSDCTIASNAPGFSVALVALGAGSLVGVWLMRGRRGRSAVVAVAALWAVVWEIAALLSVLNTTI